MNDISEIDLSFSDGYFPFHHIIDGIYSGIIDRIEYALRQETDSIAYGEIYSATDEVTSVIVSNISAILDGIDVALLSFESHKDGAP